MKRKAVLPVTVWIVVGASSSLVGPPLLHLSVGRQLISDRCQRPGRPQRRRVHTGRRDRGVGLGPLNRHHMNGPANRPARAERQQLASSTRLGTNVPFRVPRTRLTVHHRLTDGTGGGERRRPCRHADALHQQPAHEHDLWDASDQNQECGDGTWALGARKVT